MAGNLQPLKLNYSDCFNIGSVVSCRTCFQKEIEGEVLAFDSQTKILILKCPATNGRSGLCDVNFINLNRVSDVQVVKEANSVPPPPHSLSVQRLNHRLRNNVGDKKRLISALQSGVSPEGQNLYLNITKTLTEVKWDGPDIIIFDEIKIVPPYKLENIVGNTDSKSYNHIRKLVEKYTKEAQSAKKELQKTNNICVSSSNSNHNNNNNNNNCAAPLPQ